MSLKALQDYTYWSKYARHNKAEKRRETWFEAVSRVEEMHLKRYPQIAKEIKWAFDQVRPKRVLGSQRALQFGGEPIEKKNARLYNCLGVETEFITHHGVKSFSDFKDGDETIVLTHTGAWKKAIVRCFGKQKLHNIVIKRGEATHEVRATKNHHWFLADGQTTDRLQEEDTLMFAPDVFGEFDYHLSSPDERLYWAYGYTYGDGTLVKDQNGEYRYSMVRLCDDDVQYRERFEELGFATSTSMSLEGDYMAFTGKYLKTLPDPKIDSPRLIRAFIRGYMDADGIANRNRCGKYGSPSPYNGIQATGQESVDFIRKILPMAGVYVVSEADKTDEITNYGPRSGITIKFRTTNGTGRTAAKFRVEHISEDGVEEDVWCLEVEDDHSFVLPFGLVTGNCTASYCDRVRFFQEAFWLLLCGCGCGFSVQKHHVAKIPDFHNDLSFSKGKRVFQIPDTIEGWADALGVLLATYMPHSDFSEWAGYEVVFDFGKIRKKGSSLASGVGKAPGPDPLREALQLIRVLLNKLIGEGRLRLRPIDAYDIVMHASDAVLSGGVRRSATLCMFSFDDMEMILSKTGNWMAENPQRGRSNNSAVLVRNKVKWDDFYALISSVRQFGEPGFIWVEDEEALYNPCVEIGLYGYDEFGNSGWHFCNLCEINGKKLKTKHDFELAARAAAIIGTVQAGYTDFDYLGPVSKRIVDKEALLGVSITGMMDHPEIAFDPEIQREMARLILKVNAELAPRIGVNPTARATCVKPSGTASCVLGTASGVHPHHAKRYLRRIQGNKTEPVLGFFKGINPHAVEQSFWKTTDEVITFCVEVEDGAKVKNNMKATELLDYVKLTQQNWIAAGRVKDRCTKPWLMHNVSNTITVEDDEWDDVARYIYDNRQYFAGISLLSHTGDLDFPQAPMCIVHTHNEIAKMYGPGSLFLDRLIDKAERAFDTLHDACSAILGFGKPITEPIPPENDGHLYIEDRQIANEVYEKLYGQYKAKQNWMGESREMAGHYFDGDVKQLTYAMKEINNWRQWCGLSRSYKDVDYTSMVEEEDTTKPMQEWACSGGSCQML